MFAPLKEPWKIQQDRLKLQSLVENVLKKLFHTGLMHVFIVVIPSNVVFLPL